MAEGDVLRVLNDFLVNSIEIDSLLPAAWSTKLISDRQKSECSSESETFKKSEKFLEYLQRGVNGDSDKFYTFLDILREKQPDISSHLDEQIKRRKLQLQAPAPEGIILLKNLYL